MSKWLFASAVFVFSGIFFATEVEARRLGGGHAVHPHGLMALLRGSIVLIVFFQARVGNGCDSGASRPSELMGPRNACASAPANACSAES